MSGRQAAVELGQWAGLIAIPVVLGFVGYLVSKRMSAARDESVRWPMHVGIVLGLLIALAGLAQRPVQVNKPSPAANEDAPAMDEKHVVEIVDSGPSDPFPAEVPPENLEALRQTVDQMLAQNYGAQFGSVTSKISVEKFGGQTVVYYHANASKGARWMQYVGVQAGMRKVVSCFSEDGAEFPACRERAVRLFGQPSTDGAPAGVAGQ